MSVNLARVGGLEPPETTALDTTNETTVLSGTDKYLRTVEAISLANEDTSNACRITLKWVDATPTSRTYWIGSVPAGETVKIDDMPILLDGKGRVRSISATAQNANDVTVTVISSAQTKQSPLP